MTLPGMTACTMRMHGSRFVVLVSVWGGGPSCDGCFISMQRDSLRGINIWTWPQHILHDTHRRSQSLVVPTAS